MNNRFTASGSRTFQPTAVLTPRSLQKFTSGILAKGLNQLGCDLVPLSDAKVVIALLTPEIPNPTTEEGISDSKAIVALLEKAQRSHSPNDLIATFRPEPYIAIEGEPSDSVFTALFHSTFRQESLMSARPTVVDRHLHQRLSQAGLTKMAPALIPHGFFSSAPPSLLKGRVVVGTHLHPGEEVDLEKTLHTILEVLATTPAGSCIGYLGGKSGSQISCEYALAEARARHSTIDIEVVPNYFMIADAHRKRALVVADQMWEPEEYCVTIDLRYVPNGMFLQHLESIHIRPSIPVVPVEFARRYLDDRPSFTFTDFKDGAHVDTIIELIHSGGTSKLLAQASRFALALSPKRIAERYLQLIPKKHHEIVFNSSADNLLEH